MVQFFAPLQSSGADTFFVVPPPGKRNMGCAGKRGHLHLRAVIQAVVSMKRMARSANRYVAHHGLSFSEIQFP